jgi:hypothetical protein
MKRRGRGARTPLDASNETCNHEYVLRARSASCGLHATRRPVSRRRLPHAPSAQLSRADGARSRIGADAACSVRVSLVRAVFRSYAKQSASHARRCSACARRGVRVVDRVLCRALVGIDVRLAPTARTRRLTRIHCIIVAHHVVALARRRRRGVVMLHARPTRRSPQRYREHESLHVPSVERGLSLREPNLAAHQHGHILPAQRYIVRTTISDSTFSSATNTRCLARDRVRDVGAESAAANANASRGSETTRWAAIAQASRACTRPPSPVSGGRRRGRGARRAGDRCRRR